ncbi:MAG: hypothetical protein VX899_14550 [Myxococcota bacterium]|nr:hypothetical protein [Myxococcota bacterium]
MLLLLIACHKPAPETPKVDAVVAPPTEDAPAEKPAPELGPPVSLPEFPPAGEAPAMCPDGRGAVAFWVGEYPEPVIDLGAPVTLQGRTHPCVADAIVRCEVPAGVVHPWWRDNAAVTGFATVQPIARYKVTQTHSSEIAGNGAGGELAVGTEISVLTYLAEGYCRMQVGQGPIFEATCPMVASQDFEELPAKGETLQLVQVQCVGGGSAWIHDKALVSAPGARPGQMLGYGEVGPAL